MPTPITTILLVLAVTASSVENSIAYGALPFLLALVNEIARAVALRADDESLD